MADSASISPKWTRPSNTIKVKKRRRGSLATENPALSDKMNNLNTEARLSSKRKNPFSCSQKNKKLINEHQTKIHEEKPRESRVDDQNELFRRLNQASTENKLHVLPERRHSKDEDTNGSLQETEVTANQRLKEEQPPKSQQTRAAFDNFPIDWSIKTRLRFTSEKPFSWCTSLKSSDEASGLSSFVKCMYTSAPGCLKEPSCKNPDIPSHLKSMFHQHTMVWIHPSIPWFKAFPRIVPEPKIAKPSFAISSDVIEKSLFTSWCESFRSIFHLLRAKCCPYFYLCAHQFSILFQAVGIGGSKQIQAIITPTTKGFREALSREGIQFSLPALQLGDDEKTLTDSLDSSISNSNTLADEIDCVENAHVSEEVDDDDITQDDEAASSWIQSIGLDKNEFPSLDPAKVKLQRDKVVKLDHKPQSLVLVQGADTQALFNFLLNSTTTVAVAGSQAGIPPTLLAPVAFEGSTLQKCKVRNRVIKQKKQKSGALECINSLEISGVILPNSVKGLCEVLKCTQTGSYTVSFNVHESTAPFNQVHANEANQSPEKCHLIQCGLSDHMMNELYTGNALSRGFLREILCEDGKYGWSL